MYIELFLLDNLLMDALILRAACAFCARPCAPGRLWLFALFGTGYALCAATWPVLGGWPLRLLFSGVMALALPGGRGARGYLHALAGVWVAAFLVGGLGTCLACFAPETRGGLSGISLRTALLCGALAMKLPRLLRNRERAQVQTLCVAFDGCVYTLPARVDTGNALVEPLSGLPVIVADIPALRACAQIPIPAVTVQGTQTLYALRPDALTLDGEASAALVALPLQPLSFALVPPAALPQ